MKNKFLLFLVVVFAFALRVNGLNWDQGQHLHPDERFLTMVGIKIDWPGGVKDYFNTDRSSLSPYNNGYDFFVYGAFPLFLTKAVAGASGLNDYAHFNLIGRLLSAVFDTGVVVLLWLISGGVLASFVYALMVLPIQLAHFFAVDTFLNFFLLLTFYSFLVWPAAAAGLFFGLALACKISAVFFLPVVGLLFLFRFKFNFKKIFINAGLFALAVFISFRIFSPYAFKGIWRPNPQFINSLKTLQSFSSPTAHFPPAVQWIKTKPIVFPAMNLFFWGLGIPLGILAVASLGWLLAGQIKILKKPALVEKEKIYLAALFWALFLFFFQGIQFVKTMRYFLPIYPFLALIVGRFLQESFAGRWFSRKSVKLVVFVLLLVYPLAFAAIYRRPHTRVAASKWIYKNISPGSVISCEHWDDCLPLPVKGRNGAVFRYQTETLSLYDGETPAKWQKVNRQLEKIDYLILSSDRLWGSIPKVPERYPLTARFYQDLFAGKLGFKKIAEFTSYPEILGRKINDDSAEEAFTVYDHPKVMIFQKEKTTVSQKDF